jgi:quinol monooxygenase YgiN
LSGRARGLRRSVYTLTMTDQDWGYVIIWEFLPRPGQEEAFAHAYGPDGQWVQFFRRAEGYVRTDLIRDSNNPRRFLTADYWQSREAYDRFREQNRSEYEIIDQQYEGLNQKEVHLGSFEKAA